MATDSVWITILLPNESTEKASSSSAHQNFASAYHQNEISFVPLETRVKTVLYQLGVHDSAWTPTLSGTGWHVYFLQSLTEASVTLLALQDLGLGSKPDTALGFIPYSICWKPSPDGGKNELLGPAGKLKHGSPEDEELDAEELESFQSKQNKFLQSVTSHLTVSQVVESVRASSQVGFDFIFFTIFASWIACNGLIMSRGLDVAASMCIEPLMSTVVAICFGTVVREGSLFKLGCYSLLVSCILSMVTGFVYGMIAFCWLHDFRRVIPTPEMVVLGQLESLWYGTLVVIPCGGAIALCLLAENLTALVGVAIATTFMPPVANAGLLAALAIHLQILGHSEQDFIEWIGGPDNSTHLLKPSFAPPAGYTPTWFADMRAECGLLSVICLAYTAINVVGLYLAGILMLKVKEVAPLGRNMDSLNRFFHEDLRIYRQVHHNHSHSSHAHDDSSSQREVTSADRADLESQSSVDSEENDSTYSENNNQDHHSNTMSRGILKEWAKIAGIDPKTLLTDTPEARLTQLQTLRDLTADVEQDDTFQAVSERMRRGYDRPSVGGDVFRRLSKPLMARRQSTKKAESRLQSRASIFSIPTRALRQAKRSADRKLSSGPRQAFTELTLDNLAFQSSDLDLDHVTTKFGNELENLEREERTLARRRANLLLRQQLLESSHMPYSVWPSTATNDLDRQDVHVLDSQAGHIQSITSRLRRNSSTALRAGAAATYRRRKMSTLGSSKTIKL